MVSCDVAGVKKFQIPRFHVVGYGKHFLRYLGPLLWSKLPFNVTKANSLVTFKRAIGKLDPKFLMNNDDCKNCQVCST